MLSGGIVGVEYVGEEGGGPVYMTCRVEMDDAIPLQMTMGMGRDPHSVPRGLANGIERVGLS